MAKAEMFKGPDFGRMRGVIVERKTETGAIANLEFVPQEDESDISVDPMVEYLGVVMPRSLADAMMEQQNKMVG